MVSLVKLLEVVDLSELLSGMSVRYALTQIRGMALLKQQPDRAVCIYTHILGCAVTLVVCCCAHHGDRCNGFAARLLWGYLAPTHPFEFTPCLSIKLATAECQVLGNLCHKSGRRILVNLHLA